MDVFAAPQVIFCGGPFATCGAPVCLLLVVNIFAISDQISIFGEPFSADGALLWLLPRVALQNGQPEEVRKDFGRMVHEYVFSPVWVDL